MEEKTEVIIDEQLLKDKIYLIRGVQVMLDSDLAEIYGYTTKRLNEQVKNNIEKFDEEDLMFQLTKEEKDIILRSKAITLKKDEILKSKISTSSLEKQADSSRSDFLTLSKDNFILRSKFSTLEQREGRGRHSKYNVKAFTEKGLYMLATILKSPRAVEATLAIIDTFTMTRQLARTMESLQTVEDGGEQQKSLLQKTGEILADIVGNNLSTADTETEIELNFAVVKIKHKVVRRRKE